MGHAVRISGGERRRRARFLGVCLAAAVAVIPALGAGAAVEPAWGAPASASVAASAIPRGAYAFGDSVMLGAKGQLNARGIAVNAVESRQFGSVVGLVWNRRATLPRNVIIHLGTNGTVTRSDCVRTVLELGAARRVFLVTDKVPRSWQNGNNKVLRACAASFPGRVVLVDWYTYSHLHTNWFCADGFHVSCGTKGATAYAVYLKYVLVLRARVTPDDEPVPTPAELTARLADLERDGADADTWCDLGVDLADAELFTEAERCFHRSIELGNEWVQVNLGYLLEETERYDAAGEAFRRAVDSGDDSARVDLARLLLRAGPDAEGEALARQAWADGDETALFVLAEALADRGDAAGAEDLLRRAAADGIDGAHGGLADLLADAGRRAEAEQHYESAITEGDPLARNNFGVMLAAEGRDQEAEDQWVLAARDGDHEAADNLRAFRIDKAAGTDHQG